MPRNLPLNLILVLILITSAASAQTTYYISSSEGNDNNNGLSESSPFKTVNRVNSISKKAGDKILFKRGDKFAGYSLKIRNDQRLRKYITINLKGCR